MAEGQETFEKYVRKYVEHEANKYDKSIEELEKYRGKDAKSMISLIIPPTYRISWVVQLLEDEHERASFCNKEGNCHWLWSRAHANRTSFLVVVKDMIRTLKLEKFSRSNGLVMYSGLAFYGDSKEASMVQGFLEAPMPAEDFLYVCDDRFHLEAVKEFVKSWKLFVMADRYRIFQEEIESYEWRVKDLERFKGKGAKSMISVIIPPGDQISRVVKALEDELQTSDIGEDNCQCLWANHPSSLGVVRDTLKNMKLREKFGYEIPPNGLAIFIGFVIFKDGATMLNDTFPPLTPVKDFFYACDDRFHVEAIKELVESWKLSLAHSLQSNN